MLLPRAFELIELLAFAGTYTDQPTDQPGSFFLEQILTPLSIAISAGPLPNVFVVQADIGADVVGDLIAGVSQSAAGGIVWAPLKVLKDAKVARFVLGQDRKYLIECPGLRFLIFTPLVGFPLAVFPFFQNPVDPLAHFHQYVADYFPAVKRRLGGALESGRWLELSESDTRLRLWIQRAQLYVDVVDRTQRSSGVAIKFRNKAFFGLRVDAKAATTAPLEEDLSKISCRDTGAVKRTWALPDGRRARTIASVPELIARADLIELGCHPSADFDRIGAALATAERP